MKLSVVLIPALLLALNMAAYGQEFQTIKYQGKDAVKDELIIKFKRYPGIASQTETAASRAGILRNKKASVNKIWSTGAEYWKVSTDNIDALIKELSGNPDVEYVEPNYIFHASIVPNDPDFKYCWAVNGTTMADIHAMDAWGITTGDSSIVVGVIDSGIDYLHEDLKANIWTNPHEIAGNGIDDDHNGYIDDIHGWDFINNKNSPMDSSQHGTHVAGIIAAKGNNKTGIAGVAWNVKLAALRFLGDRGGKTTMAIDAIEYCINNGIKITNNSWGGSGGSQALYDEISKANQAGVLMIVAAGNSTLNIETNPQYPASYDLPNIISVAANDASGNLTSFSNYGKTSVDLSAPGVNIYSSVPGNSYMYKDGTSMAAPFVTGAVALIKSVYPGKTSTEIKNLLLESVDISSSMTGKTVTGGILNVYKPLANSDTTSVRLSASELNFGGVVINSGNMPQKKFTVYNSSAKNVNIDTIKSKTGFLISSSGGIFSDVLVNTLLPANQPVDIYVKADPKETRPYDTLITLRFSREGAIWIKEVRCRFMALPKGTLITSEEVSGSWSKAMSPVIINSTVKVPSGQKLDIEPGTEVIFFNNSGISSASQDAGVQYNIRAAGTKQDSIYFRSIDPKAPWSGFTFTGRGKYIFEYCNFLNASKNNARMEGDAGGAIYCYGPDLRIVNSYFLGNHAAGKGGAVAFTGSEGTAFIDSSRFYGNDADEGGALLLRGKENWLMNSEFRNNKCTQGIVKIQGTSKDSNEKAFVYNCRFIRNTSSNGGSMADATSINKVVIKNCLGARNNVIQSQGLINLNTVSTAIISNCTLCDNSTTGSGTALAAENVTDCVLENSILWDNFSNEITAGQGVNENFTYNSIKNYGEVNGNTSTLPEFADTLTFRLAENSILRDMGNPLIIYTDMDGSRNDPGYEGGNPLVFYPARIDFGKNGVVNSTPKILTAQCVSFYKDAIPLVSWNVSSTEFAVSEMPAQILPFRQNEITISFSPKQIKIYADTLYINTSLIQGIKVLLTGVSADIISIGGPISGELKQGIYLVVNDLFVPKDKVLTIDAGVTLMFQPGIRFTVDGDLEVKGTPEQKVVFSSDAETSYAGIITVRGNNTKNILLENVSIRRMLGFNIKSLSRKIVFNNCEFTDNRNSSEKNAPYFYNHRSVAEFIQCRFTGNSTEGPLIYSDSGRVFVNNCLMSRNSSKKAYLLLECNKTYIYNSSIFSNKSDYGILVSSDPMAGASTDSCKVINTILADNINASATYKYELSLVPRTSPEPTGNPAVNVYFEFTNSCIKDNRAKLFMPASATKSLILPFEADPAFADENGNLSGSSPLINGGTNTYAGLPFSDMDLAGNYRIWNRRIDIGAYEYGSKKYYEWPEKTYPASPKDSSLIAKEVTFNWKAVPGALTYYLQVSNNIAFDNRITDSTLTDTTKTISLNPGTKYFWRVRAQNNLHPGQWSDVWSFTTFKAAPEGTVVLSTPKNAAVNQPLALSLKWRILKTAEKYQIQVSPKLNFTNLLVNDSTLADTLKQVTGLSNNSTYYWRVRAVNQGGPGPWSEEWYFTTMPPAPDVPLLAMPLNDTKNNTVSLKLAWKTNRYTDRYRLIIAEDDKLSKVYFADSMVTDTVKQVKALKEGMKYFWKVSSINAAGESYSGAWAFTTLLSAPDSLKAKVLSGNRPQLQLSWADTTNGETGFIIERKQSADFTVLDTVGANITSYTDSTVEVSSSYEYRVRSCTPYVLSAYTGPVSVTVSGVDERSLIPKDYVLMQNYPNPFNPSTIIKYGLPSESRVKLTVFNCLGEAVREYINEIQNAGYHQISLNAGGIASGVYYYLLDARATDGSRDFRKVKKMVIVK